jgi:hypothetical protein
MKILARLILVFAMATALFAQEAKGNSDQAAKEQPPKKDSSEVRDPAPIFDFFKLSFVVYEVDDGKRINQRDYMMMVRADNQPSSIRIGTRVPILVGESKTATQYVDAGLTLRCFTRKERPDQKLAAQCDIEVSSFVRPDQVAGGANAPSAPVLRSTHTSSWALLTLGKSTVLATVDDINSAKRMQIEVTATKVE